MHSLIVISKNKYWCSRDNSLIITSWCAIFSSKHLCFRWICLLYLQRENLNQELVSDKYFILFDFRSNYCWCAESSQTNVKQPNSLKHFVLVKLAYCNYFSTALENGRFAAFRQKYTKVYFCLNVKYNVIALYLSKYANSRYMH